MANDRIAPQPIVTEPEPDVPAMTIEPDSNESDPIPEPEAVPAPEPDPDPASSVVLSSDAGDRIVAVAWPRRRHQYADGLAWVHVGEDSQGRWIYRPA